MTMCNWWLETNKIDMNYRNDRHKIVTCYQLPDGNGDMRVIGLLR